ncbi:hypothetical protein D3C83_176790 [compost metagenome]
MHGDDARHPQGDREALEASGFGREERHAARRRARRVGVMLDEDRAVAGVDPEGLVDAAAGDGRDAQDRAERLE